MTIPNIYSFDHLLTRAIDKTRDECPTATLLLPSDIDMLKAFIRATDEKLIAPIIVGDEALLKKNAAANGLNVDGVEILDINQPDIAIGTVLQMAGKGEVDLIVKGRAPHEDFIASLSDSRFGFVPNDSLLSHIAIIKPEQYAKLLFLIDGGIYPQPDLKQKVGLIQKAVEFCDKVGINNPRVAVIAAVEVVYPQMPVTVDAAEIAKMGERGQITGAHIDGPLSLDVATDIEVAHSKGIKNSSVAGQADILVAPNVETAVGMLSAMSLFGKSEVGSVIYGGRVPVALTGRLQSTDDKFRSIVLAILGR